MRIALVGTPLRPVPPIGYGPVERLLAMLTAGLRSRGHSVDVMSGWGEDAEPSVLDATQTRLADEPLSYELCWNLFLTRVSRQLRGRSYDIVHEHSNHGTLATALAGPGGRCVSTVHTPIGHAQRALMQRLANEVSWVAISQAQCKGVEFSVSAVIPNAVAEWELVDRNAVRPEPGGYLLHLGRIHPDKGQHIAIEVARRVGLPLVLAGKVDRRNPDYFSRCVAPHVGERVRWYHNIAGADRARLLADARALIFPIQWHEPFGLAMVEAMASGTPVVATPRGAAPELIEPWQTGLLAADIDGLVQACHDVLEIDRIGCAAHARKRFSVRQMIDSYEHLYRVVA